MGAVYLLKTLIICEPAMDKLEAAQNVMNELQTMKRLRKSKKIAVPYMTINRAIRIQERLIKNL